MNLLVKSVRQFLTSEDGPTAVEYAVMLALIVLFAAVLGIPGQVLLGRLGPPAASPEVEGHVLKPAASAALKPAASPEVEGHALKPAASAALKPAASSQAPKRYQTSVGSSRPICGVKSRAIPAKSIPQKASARTVDQCSPTDWRSPRISARAN